MPYTEAGLPLTSSVRHISRNTVGAAVCGSSAAFAVPGGIAAEASADTITVRRVSMTRSPGVRVPVERDHGFRWKMITESGGT